MHFHGCKFGLEDHLPYGHTLCYCLFQQRQALGYTPGQGIGKAQGRAHTREPELQVSHSDIAPGRVRAPR